MTENYASMQLPQLREIAKSKGIRRVTTIRKSELIQILTSLAEKEEARAHQKNDLPVSAAEPVSEAGHISESSPEASSPQVSAQSQPAQAVSRQASDAGPHRGRPSGVRQVYPRTAAPSVSNTSAGHTAQPRAYSAPRTADRTAAVRPGGGYRPSYNQSGYNSHSTPIVTSRQTYQASNPAPVPSGSSMAPAGTVPSAPSRVSVPVTPPGDLAELDSGIPAHGILEVMPDGYGFIRCENFLPGENDVYVSPSQIRRFNLKTGDIISGATRIKSSGEKFAALLYVNQINDLPTIEAESRTSFEDLTPVFPDSRLRLEMPDGGRDQIPMRILDLLSPIGKGQRGMIVSPPKAGKTTLLKQVASSIKRTHPEIHLIVLLIDERPEEVTDIKEAIAGPSVEVIYSTFDELPEHHKRVSEMVIERAKRLVEHKRDVVILLDSITRLARAYNLTVAPSGRTLSGGLDPAALHMPKRFFGAARNTREGGSLTILATALVDTGSRMDDVVFEEFKGTGNMELVLDRRLSERRIFPAIDILKSGTRRDDLLLTPQEQEAADIIHKATNGLRADDAVERILDLFARTRNNSEFIAMLKKTRLN
ncbi:transcription termination factor Rho [Cuneatibacter caecimuris]|uniref:Transcription termination factor Rho n=1 Tax=Cuneatibacter caecimuris TaxID=1796618 RepID=A0A4Q7PPL2_9FIRM|nr:transcription termination factor Rho [Cuneatibacter caecimuris]RZT02435.1 transcription termination factor Rho [Cuneatibacter caecimuris]